MREITREEVFAFIRNMTPLELAEFIRDLGEELGVSLAGADVEPEPFVTMGMPPEPYDMGMPSYDVRLIDYSSDHKIRVIKAIRELRGFGLRDAKELVESAPCLVGEGLDREVAEAMVRSLEDVGARVELV